MHFFRHFAPRYSCNSARSMLAIGVRNPTASQCVRLAFHGCSGGARFYAKQPDIRQVPLNRMGVMTRIYVPPPLTKHPLQKWPRLILRRIGAFALSTIHASKLKKSKTNIEPFGHIKEKAVEIYVRTNKVFSESLNKGENLHKRQKYNVDQLCNIVGHDVLVTLNRRAISAPLGMKSKWDLTAITENPKIVSLMTMPDANDLTCYVQFVMSLKSKQRLTLTTLSNTVVTERTATDYLVYSMNPWTNDLFLVGSIFESGADDKLTPGVETMSQHFSAAMCESASDLYRSSPHEKVVEVERTNN